MCLFTGNKTSGNDHRPTQTKRNQVTIYGLSLPSSAPSHRPLVTKFLSYKENEGVTGSRGRGWEEQHTS